MYEISMDSLTGLGVVGSAAIAKLPKFEKWEPGKKLKILLVGYNGKRNTGADVRVAAMVEQFYRILGEDKIEIGILTLDIDMTKVYFTDKTRLIKFSTIFFKDILDACSEYHMAVLSEGSTLKSKFANALTLFFCEAAGIMKKQGKPCLAYGSEAGDMDQFVKDIVARLCKDTYFIARTEPSLKIINDMGMKGHLGTDTAWTFPPAKHDWAVKELIEKSGWDGKKPIVGVAVINPFEWPVKPDLIRTVKSLFTRNWKDHYEKYYFFASSPEREQKYKDYIAGIASAVDAFREKHDVHVIAIGMEALDLGPINDLSKSLKSPVAFFSSKFYDGYQMSAILHSLSMLVTSRYHARVLSMNGGIPSIAVSMDERLYNIFQECGHLEDYYLTVDEPDLGPKLLSRMEKLWTNREKVSTEIWKSLPRYLRVMSDMGKFFRGWILEQFPGVDLAPAPKDWLGYLPKLPAKMKKLVQENS